MPDNVSVRDEIRPYEMAVKDAIARLSEKVQTTVDQSGASVAERLLRIEAQLGIILAKEAQMAGELDQLTVDIATNTTIVSSAISLLNGLHAALADAIASGDMSRVAALNATIEANNQALVDAVVANTPAEPPPPTP